MVKKEVLILGGGFAGLAAGVFLSSKGHQVTLIERRGHLGGRAYSYRDPVTGSILDNGQHILMGCYRDTLEFLETIGTLKKLSFQKRLSVEFAAPGGRRGRFRALPLPAPLDLMVGFFLFRGLSPRDLWRAARFGQGIKRLFRGPADSLQILDRKSIPEWLSECGQSEKIQEMFWNPLAFAALNDRPEISSAALMATVIQEALLSGRKNSRIGLPRTGLSDLYTDAARDFIESHGGQCLLKAPVFRLHFKEREFQEAELEGGRRVSAEILLSTIPFTALRKILPDRMLYDDPFFAPLSRLRVSPITAINLWFDREITKSPFVGFWGTRIHWLFNKGRLLSEGPPYLSLVISGSRDEMKMAGPDLIALAQEELGQIYPEAAKARLLRSMVTKEPEATLSPEVGISRFRLPQKTPYSNFFLAGDWTDTGLPATIESAVRSAKRAVELIGAD